VAKAAPTLEKQYEETATAAPVLKANNEQAAGAEGAEIIKQKQAALLQQVGTLMRCGSTGEIALHAIALLKQVADTTTTETEKVHQILEGVYRAVHGIFFVSTLTRFMQVIDPKQKMFPRAALFPILLPCVFSCIKEDSSQYDAVKEQLQKAIQTEIEAAMSDKSIPEAVMALIPLVADVTAKSNDAEDIPRLLKAILARVKGVAPPDQAQLLDLASMCVDALTNASSWGAETKTLKGFVLQLDQGLQGASLEALSEAIALFRADFSDSETDSASESLKVALRHAFPASGGNAVVAIVGYILEKGILDAAKTKESLIQTGAVLSGVLDLIAALRQVAKISTFFKNGKPKEAAVVQLLGMNGVTIEMLLALLFASTFYIFCTCTFILLGMHVFTAGGESIADVTSGVSTILIGGSILWANKQAKKEVSDTGDNLQTTKLISNCISTFKAMLDRQTPTASLSDPAAHVFCIAEAPASGEAPKEKTRAHRRESRKVSPV